MKRASGKDTLYILNFWATWCAPCVKELPIFNNLYTKYAGKPVKIILVSFDFKEAYPTTLQQFVHNRGLLPEVVWLNETNADVFIPNINARWRGALPATIVVQPAHKVKQLWEGTITEKEISDAVDKQLSTKK